VLKKRVQREIYRNVKRDKQYSPVEGEGIVQGVRRSSILMPACHTVGPWFDSRPGHPGGPFAEQKL